MSDEAGKTKKAQPTPVEQIYGTGARRFARPRRKTPSLAEIFGMDSYRICTAKTGHISSRHGELRWVGGVMQLFVEGSRVDLGSDYEPILVDKRRIGGHSNIVIPGQDIRFKLGSAKPLNKFKFNRAIGRMVKSIRETVSGAFRERCLKDQSQLGGRPVLYVVGKTDRLGDDRDNVELSFARARRVAEALYAKRAQMGEVTIVGGGTVEVDVKYIGLGESGSETADETASPKDRCVDFLISSVGPPFKGDWRSVQPEGERRGRGGPTPGVRTTRA